MAKRKSSPPGWQVWLLTGVVVVGAVVIGLGLVVNSWPVFGAGWAVVVAGIIYGRVINAMEYTEEEKVEGQTRTEPGTARPHG